MSLRVYVNKEGRERIKNMPGFYMTGTGTEQWVVPKTITLAYEKSCCFLTLNEVSDPIPPMIRDFVEEVTLREYHSASKRESGIYRHKTAEAEVTREHSALLVSIFIRGKSKDDVVNLLQQIKTGTIRPEESYEAPQDGMSSEEIHAKLKEELRSANAQISDLSNRIREASNYALLLRKRKMPILPQVVVGKLDSIFCPRV